MTNQKTSKISIIIPNLNGAHFLKNCLASLKAQTLTNFELIVVDNNSSDDSLELAKQEFPAAITHRFNKNEGFSRAVNQGVALANSEYVFLLNNDTELEPHCLEEIVSFLDKNNQVSFGATKMLYYHDHKIINNAGDTFSIYGVASRRGNQEPDTGQYEVAMPVTGACAGAAFYRRSLLNELGGFDEDFFAYIEDVDLSLRAQLLGHKCWYLPTAIVYHVDGGTSQKFKNFSFFLVARNNLYTIMKNFPAVIIIITAPFLLLSQIRNLINGYRYHCFKLIIKIYSDFFKNFNTLYQERKAIQKNRKINVWQFWRILSKKNTFVIKKIFYDFFPHHN